MKELVRSNDPVFISWLMTALEGAGIHVLVLDQHMSIVEGSLGILPRRVLVPEDELEAAKAVLAAGPEQAMVEGIVLDNVATTADSLLGGKVVFYQPAEGYRAAIDPVLLAAAVPARAGEHVLDLGAGAGAAALCLARRVPECRVTGLEIDPALVSIARTNAAENGFGERLEFVAGNVAAPPRELRPGSFDAVMLNPPYRAENSGTPPRPTASDTICTMLARARRRRLARPKRQDSCTKRPRLATSRRNTQAASANTAIAAANPPSTYRPSLTPPACHTSSSASAHAPIA